MSIVCHGALIHFGGFIFYRWQDGGNPAMPSESDGVEEVGVFASNEGWLLFGLPASSNQLHTSIA
jgi:hypothetical protein